MTTFRHLTTSSHDPILRKSKEVTDANQLFYDLKQCQRKTDRKTGSRELDRVNQPLEVLVKFYSVWKSRDAFHIDRSMKCISSCNS